MRKGAGLGRRPELVGGGLTRSLGGWSEVLAFRKRGEKQVSDTRILGDSQFVQEVTSDLDDLVKRNLRLSGRQIDVATLAKRVCKKHDISVGELRSGSRRREIIEDRGIVSWIVVRELGCSGADWENARIKGLYQPGMTSDWRCLLVLLPEPLRTFCTTSPILNCS